MGAVRPAAPVKLLCGLLAGSDALLQVARDRLADSFGPIDHTSPARVFDQTSYYTSEMGPNLLRQFVAFADLIAPDQLARAKLRTNALEHELAAAHPRPGGGRRVNLDPGYIDLGKLVLATTKDRTHRVYLGDGICAEVTLGFENRAWRVWPWTYPDYQLPEHQAFFTTVRDHLHQRRRATASGAPA